MSVYRCGRMAYAIVVISDQCGIVCVGVKGIVPRYKDRLLTNNLIPEALWPHAPTYIIKTHIFYTILIPRRLMCRARVDRC